MVEIPFSRIFTVSKIIIRGKGFFLEIYKVRLASPNICIDHSNLFILKRKYQVYLRFIWAKMYLKFKNRFKAYYGYAFAWLFDTTGKHYPGE